MELKNIRPIEKERCMLLMDNKETMDVVKIYNNAVIKEYKKLYSKDDYILIFNPSKEQKQSILQLLLSRSNGDLKKIQLTQLELMNVIAPMITTLRYNSKKKKDIEQLKSLINNNHPLIEELDRELGKILNNIIFSYLDNLETLSEMPEKYKEAFLNTFMMKAKEDELIAEKNKIEELKKQVADIDG